MKWIDFILANFKSGTATEIAKHIEKVANEKGYKPNNHTKIFSVFRLLPEHSRGVIRPGSDRKEKEHYFININGIYDLKDSVIKNNTLVLNKDKKISLNLNNPDEKIEIEVQKNKSTTHNKMLLVLKRYMEHNDIDHEVEYKNIDLVTSVNNQIDIYEVKSYKGSEYMAIGQLLFYKSQLNVIFPNKNIKMHFIVPYDQNDKFTNIFNILNIKHTNIKEYSNP